MPMNLSVCLQHFHRNRTHALSMSSQKRCAVYLGLPDLLVVAVVRTMGPNPYFRDSQALRTLDVYGNNLSMYMGTGYGRTAFHN